MNADMIFAIVMAVLGIFAGGAGITISTISKNKTKKSVSENKIESQMLHANNKELIIKNKTIEERINVLETKSTINYKNNKEEFNKINKQMDKFDNKIEKLNDKIDGMNTNFEKKIDDLRDILIHTSKDKK